MKDSPSVLSPRQAGELAGKTARHIQHMINDGRLSATKQDGRYYIDKAEFFRVFPEAHMDEQKRNRSGLESEKERLEFENGMLKEIASSRNKEIEFLRNQIESISLEKTKMLEVISTHTRILGQRKSDFHEQ